MCRAGGAFLESGAEQKAALWPVLLRIGIYSRSGGTKRQSAAVVPFFIQVSERFLGSFWNKRITESN